MIPLAERIESTYKHLYDLRGPYILMWRMVNFFL
jgi:hypothetical protein